MFPLLICSLLAFSVPGETPRPRVIVTTDGEIDDRSSMIRFLLCAHEWRICGLIHSSSKHHWKGDKDHPEFRWEGTEWLDRQLDAYASVYPNLVQHDDGFPSPDYLRSQVFVGNVDYEGEMLKRTPGAKRIVDILLNEDPSPVWLQAWGGPNTISRALKIIQEDYPERMEEVSRKARVFLISHQDQTCREYIQKEWPDVEILLCLGNTYGPIAYLWQQQQPADIQAYFNSAWMAGNILKKHGPLCAMYEARNGQFTSEGDTPAFLHVIGNGLRSDENPTFGGWGGRFRALHGVWKSVDKKGDSHRVHSLLRWAKHFQNDWAARADWCVQSFDEANHPPHVAIAGSLDRVAHAGDSVGLNATASNDPDNDEVKFHWWPFVEASSCESPASIASDREAEAVVKVPSTAQAGDTIHVICEVTDTGIPSLTRYQRVVITIAERNNK